MWMIKAVCVIWVLCGVGLVGYGAWESLQSYLIISSTDMASVEGTVIDKYSRTEEVYRSGRREVYVWFPQPVVEWVDRSGVTQKSTDHNVVPFFLYKKGQKVPLKVFEDTSQAYIDDLYTRFAFPTVLTVLGLIFIILPVVGWRILNASEVDLINDLNVTVQNTPLNQISENVPFNIKYFLWAFLGLIAFAILMTVRPYFKGLVSEWMPSAEDAFTPESEKTADAQPQSWNAKEVPVRQEDTGTQTVDPEKVVERSMQP